MTLATAISVAMDRQVEDRTGLTGRFTMHLSWADTAGLSALTAVRKQLGLTLVPIGLVDRQASVSEAQRHPDLDHT